MKELKWSTKSWHSWVYSSAYNDYSLPTDICSYFWKLVWALILFIPAWPGHLMNWISDKWDKDMESSANWWSIHVPLAAIISTLWLPEKQHHLVKYWYLIGVGTTVLLVGGFMIGALIVMGIGEGGKWVIRKCSKDKEGTPSPIVEGLKAWKNKYCKKITWD